MRTRVRIKQLRSYYYDRITRTVGAARKMPTYPASRPHRYIFLGQYYSRSKKALWKQLLENHGITTKTKRKIIHSRKEAMFKVSIRMNIDWTINGTHYGQKFKMMSLSEAEATAKEIRNKEGVTNFQVFIKETEIQYSYISDK